MQTALESFGQRVLVIMEEAPEWDVDTTDSIATLAFNSGLADMDERGRFRKILPAVSWMDKLPDYEILQALEIARLALKNEYASHQIGCEMDMTEEEQQELQLRLEHALS
jgi:hypothetical protein